jgi:hypothetical protein
MKLRNFVAALFQLNSVTKAAMITSPLRNKPYVSVKNSSLKVK